jgi:hypothetical protein
MNNAVDMRERLEAAFERHEFRADLDRIIAAVAAHNLRLSYAEATAIWLWHSDRQATSWSDLPTDDDAIWQIIQAFMEHE